MDLSKAEYDRAESLADSKVMSVQDLDEKKAQYAVAVARWEKAKTQRDYAVIRAPVRRRRDGEVRPDRPEGDRGPHEPLFKITATEPLLARIYLPEERAAPGPRGRPGRGRCRALPRREDDGRGPVHQPDRRRGERHLPGRGPRPARAGASRCCAPGWRSRSASRRPRPGRAASGATADAAERPVPRRACARRSTACSSTTSRTCRFASGCCCPTSTSTGRTRSSEEPSRDLLASTVERLEDIAGRFVEREDALLIKVALDVNELLRKVAGKPTRRGAARNARRTARPCRSRWATFRGSGETRSISATPSRACSRTRCEAAGPEGKVLVRSYTGGSAPAAPRGRGVHRQWRRDDAGVPARPALPALRDDETGRRGPRPRRPPARSCGSTGDDPDPFAARAAGRSIRLSLAGQRRGGGVTEPARPLGRIVIVEDDAFLLEQLTWALKGRFAVVVGPRRDPRPGPLRLGTRTSTSSTCGCRPPARCRRGSTCCATCGARDPEATVVMMSGRGGAAARAAGGRARRLRLLPEADRHGGAPR